MDIAKIRKRLKKNQRFAEAKKKKSQKAALSLRPMGSQRTRLPMILHPPLAEGTQQQPDTAEKTEDSKQQSEDISQGQGQNHRPMCLLRLFRSPRIGLKLFQNSQT